MATGDNYHFVYLFRAHPQAATSRPLATVFIGAISITLFVIGANGLSLLYDSHKAAAARKSRICRTKARHWYSVSFKKLDDRENGYISIEKLRYFLSTSYPAVPFEQIAQMLRRNVEEQSGLLDFFDYCTVMDIVVAHRDPDAVLFYSTHKWHTLPLLVVMLNGVVLAFRGTFHDAATLDSVHAFFIFLYAVEIGASPGTQTQDTSLLLLYELVS